jgi:putative ABC transport system ATP-binding protein
VNSPTPSFNLCVPASRSALAVVRILNQMATQYHTAIVVTHDEKIIPTFKRIHHIRNGRTEGEAGQGLSP